MGVEIEEQTQATTQAEAALAASIAPALAARTRLSLLQAWKQVLCWRERTKINASHARGPLVDSGTPRNGVGTISRGLVENMAGEQGVSSVMGSVGEGADVISSVERVLGEACRRGRIGGRSGGDNLDVAHRRAPADGAQSGEAAAVGSTTAVPSFIEMDIPCLAEVERTLADGSAATPALKSNSGSGEPPSIATAPSVERCLLCMADMIGIEGTAINQSADDSGMRRKDAGGRTFEGAAGAEAGGGESGDKEEGGILELPGWATCRRGHRFRRCMDTLAPTMSVEYRRCDVCRCVMEMGGSSRGEAVARSVIERERGTCVFCDVLVTATGCTI